MSEVSLHPSKTDLPTEIVIEIFEFLRLSLSLSQDRWGGSWKTTRNWSNCALVCTTWSPVAREFQLRDMELRLCVKPDPEAVLRLDRTIAVFRANPALSGYVQAICLTGGHMPYDKSDVNLVRNMVKVCSFLSELRFNPDRFHRVELSALSFASWRFSSRPIREAVSGGIKNVMRVSRMVKLDDVVFRSSEDFIHLVRFGNAHGLVELDIRQVSFSGGGYRESTSSLFASQSSTTPQARDSEPHFDAVSFRYFGGKHGLSALPVGPILGSLVSSEKFGLRSIHTLDIFWMSDLHKDYLYLLRHVGTRLTGLKLIIAGSPAHPNSSSGFDEPGHVWALREYVPCCPALKTLSIRVTDKRSGTVYRSAIEGLLQSFGPGNCLEEFQLDWMYPSYVEVRYMAREAREWERLDEVLADERRFPHLRRVRHTFEEGVCDQYYADRASEDMPLRQIAEMRFPKVLAAGRLHV